MKVKFFGAVFMLLLCTSVFAYGVNVVEEGVILQSGYEAQVDPDGDGIPTMFEYEVNYEDEGVSISNLGLVDNCPTFYNPAQVQAYVFNPTQVWDRYSETYFVMGEACQYDLNNDGQVTLVDYHYLQAFVNLYQIMCALNGSYPDVNAICLPQNRLGDYGTYTLLTRTYSPVHDGRLGNDDVYIWTNVLGLPSP